MRADLNMWLTFLRHPTVFCRPFLDFSRILVADEIDMFSDASGVIGMGAICGESWMYKLWSESFIKSYNPSIEYLELYAVTATVLTWIHKFRNKRIILFCDNQCCEYDQLDNNFLQELYGVGENDSSQRPDWKCFAKHVEGVKNTLADSLSRNKVELFKALCQKQDRTIDVSPTPIPDNLWPIEKIWLK